MAETELPILKDYAISGAHKEHPNVFYGTLRATGLEVVVKSPKPIELEGYNAEDIGQICICYEHATQTNLDHTNILAPLELYYHENKFYLVTPKVGQSDLNPEKPEIQAMPDSIKLTLLTQVASALAYSHRNDIVHLDVKGRNIRVDNKKAIVIDWGSAKRIGEKHEVMDKIHMSTPEIVAPEYFFSQTATPSADVFSLCCLVYRLLTKKEPFTYDEHLDALIYHKPRHNKEDIEKFKAGETIRTGMALYRNQRPDMKEIEDVLKEEAARWGLQPSEEPSEPSPVLVQ